MGTEKTTRITTYLSALLLLIACVCAPACGGDDDDSGGDDTAAAGNGGTGGSKNASGGNSAAGTGVQSPAAGGTSGGTGGAKSGSGGMSAGTGGKAPPAPPKPVMCGSASCTASGGLFHACCLDADKSTCGIENTMLNVKCSLPAVLDPNCPDHPAAMGRTSQGCCSADHVCGSALSGSPCFVASADAGEPIPCTAGPDAGM